jgi:transcriptional regulator with GAF, ATPase, and Fis domain
MPYDTAIEQLERAMIVDALDAANGSVTKAAERLGIERSRLGKLRKRLGIGE